MKMKNKTAVVKPNLFEQSVMLVKWLFKSNTNRSIFKQNSPRNISSVLKDLFVRRM